MERVVDVQTVAALRATLGEQAFATAWASGETLPLDDLLHEVTTGPRSPVALWSVR